MTDTKKPNIEQLALREIAWAAAEGFRRDHQGAQGIISDSAIDDLPTTENQHRFIETVLTLLRSFGFDDEEQIEELRKQEHEEILRFHTEIIE